MKLKNNIFKTPLYVAVEKENIEIVRFLINNENILNIVIIMIVY